MHTIRWRAKSLWWLVLVVILGESRNNLGDYSRRWACLWAPSWVPLLWRPFPLVEIPDCVSGRRALSNRKHCLLFPGRGRDMSRRPERSRLCGILTVTDCTLKCELVKLWVTSVRVFHYSDWDDLLSSHSPKHRRWLQSEEMQWQRRTDNGEKTVKPEQFYSKNNKLNPRVRLNGKSGSLRSGWILHYSRDDEKTSF